jgi:hypothetical protein
MKFRRMVNASRDAQSIRSGTVSSVSPNGTVILKINALRGTKNISRKLPSRSPSYPVLAKSQPLGQQRSPKIQPRSPKTYQLLPPQERLSSHRDRPRLLRLNPSNLPEEAKLW